MLQCGSLERMQKSEELMMTVSEKEIPRNLRK